MASQSVSSIPVENGNRTAGFPHVSTSQIFRPEHNPFQTLMVDVTHRCNMVCRNCYIPNRDLPDMDIDWMCTILAKLPKRTRIRIVGAEPTVRRDLPEIVSRIRNLGHLPILMTNGLKLANLAYLKTLKRARLRSVYLSVNGAFDDDAYEILDDLRCATRKRQALDNLCEQRMYVSLGMIVAPGVNEHLIGDVLNYAVGTKQIYELHFRSVAPFGRYMEGDTFNLEELVCLFAQGAGIDPEGIVFTAEGESYREFRFNKIKIQMTCWPDLNSERRGRLAPDGTIQRFFEHMIANQGGY